MVGIEVDFVLIVVLVVEILFVGFSVVTVVGIEVDSVVIVVGLRMLDEVENGSTGKS